MPYGKKRTKRRRNTAGRRRKSNVKRGLSSKAKEEVIKLVHGEAEKSCRTVEARDENLLTGATKLVSGVYKFAPPSVIKIGALQMFHGDGNYERRGEEINMRSIKLRMWFKVRTTSQADPGSGSSEYFTNLVGPRRVLWWVVSYKPNTMDVPAHPGNIKTAVGVNFVQGENSDFTKFFRVCRREGERPGELDPSAAVAGVVRNFEGDFYDAVDSVNRDLFTVHHNGHFDIGYSSSPTFMGGSGFASDDQRFWQKDYGRVPYRKDITIPMPKFMLGKTTFQSAYYTAPNDTADTTDKSCFVVMTSVPLTTEKDNNLVHSGIEYDYRCQYHWTDM